MNADRSDRFALTRRRLLASLPAAALLATPGRPRAGCQANAWTFPAGDFPALLRVLETIRTLGYAGFECNVRFVQDQFANAREARAQMEKTGVRFIGPHTNMDPFTPEKLAEVAPAIAALGAEAVVMSGKGLAPDGKFDQAALERKAAGLEARARICRKHGLRLAYHNHQPEFASGGAEMEGLVRHTELLEFLVDAGIAYQAGGNVPEFFSRHHGRIYGFHLRDYRSRKQQVPLGAGEFDMRPLAAEIRKTGWSGWLLPEEGPGRGKAAEDAMAPDREFLRRIFGV
jgi:sugar phosphate isomerase/epimerase